MLTVKVEGIHGDESVFQARHVIANSHLGRVRRVECYDERYDLIQVMGQSAVLFGRVFVMNDNGKTVAAYTLVDHEETK